METFTLENLMLENMTDSDNILGRVELHTSENSEWELNMGEENGKSPMGNPITYTTGSSKTTKRMVMAFSLGHREMCTKGTLLMMKEMVKVK
jgi:hypothetical protein